MIWMIVCAVLAAAGLILIVWTLLGLVRSAAEARGRHDLPPVRVRAAAGAAGAGVCLVA